jgi:hypothetical protein
MYIVHQGCPVLVLFLGVLCAASPLLAVLSCLFCTGSPSIAVLFLQSCPAAASLSWQLPPCPGSCLPVLALVVVYKFFAEKVTPLKILRTETPAQLEEADFYN